MKTKEQIIKMLHGRILWLSYGGGTNSTAKILKLIELNIIPDLITFADTGGEHLHTYEYVDMFNQYIQSKGFPQITKCEYHTKEGKRLTLEEECITNKQLPSLAYGFKTCSLKHKLGAQEQYVKKHNVFGKYVSEARNGNCDRIVRTIGYDAGEQHRMINATT